jgi:hypothetical protein
MNEHASHTHDTPSSVKPETGLSLGWILEWLKKVWEAITGGGQKPPVHSHPVQHFMLGKIILHFEHPDGTTPAQLAQYIGGFLEEQGQNQPWRSKLAPPKPEDILTFHPTEANQKALSIVPTRLRDEQTGLEDLTELLKTIHAELSQSSVTITGNVKLNSVAPNWLVGSASHGIGTTGPGAWPTEAPPPTENSWEFHGHRDENSTNEPFDPNIKVHVAILDSAPSVLDLDEAHSTWNTHPLLKQLWDGGVNRKLRLHTDIPADLNIMDLGLSGHRYSMPDHGLFIAGIISSIAPQAELHLIKTFTPYGVSSAEIIARALLRALALGRPLIINCSFNLSEDEDNSLPHEIQDMVRRSWQDLFNWIAAQQDVVVVAAAGNDAEPNQRRPDARKPVAFGNVLGVGALPKSPTATGGRYKTASYSNKSYAPPNTTGYVTIGGEPGVGQGILGVYISDFPVYAPVYSKGCLAFLWHLFNGKIDDWKGPGHLPPHPYELTSDQVRYRPNRTGWAWWAGTSFATPVISAILANWRNLPNQGRAAAPADRPINLDNARRVLNDHSQRDQTDQNENVILLSQG